MSLSTLVLAASVKASIALSGPVLAAGGGIVGCGDNTLNPCANAPAAVQSVASTLIGWTRWCGVGGGVFGLMSCGIMMAIGRRNRSHLAGEGASGIPWVLGGLSVIALAYGVVSQVLS